MEYTINIELLNSILNEKGLNQRRLAEMAGLSFEGINRIFRGRVLPNAQTMYLIADALELDSQTAGLVFFMPVSLRKMQ